MNRRDLLKMLAAAVAAPYVGPATGQEIAPARLSPGVANWGPLFHVSGFGDVPEAQVGSFAGYFYNQVADSRSKEANDDA